MHKKLKDDSCSGVDSRHNLRGGKRGRDESSDKSRGPVPLARWWWVRALVHEWEVARTVSIEYIGRARKAMEAATERMLRTTASSSKPLWLHMVVR